MKWRTIVNYTDKEIHANMSILMNFRQFKIKDIFLQIFLYTV